MSKPLKCFAHRNALSRSLRRHEHSAVSFSSRRPPSVPIYYPRSQLVCPKCGHRMSEHLGFPDPLAAEQLSDLYSGCLDCTLCADES